MFPFYTDILNNKGKTMVYEHTSKQNDETETAHQILPPSKVQAENGRNHVEKLVGEPIYSGPTELYSKGNLKTCLHLYVPFYTYKCLTLRH